MDFKSSYIYAFVLTGNVFLQSNVYP